MNKNAFTLAEILITLGIIGVIAAITIPNIINHYKEQTTVNKLKKVYSALNQAYSQILIEEGGSDNWINYNLTQQKRSKQMADKFKPYLKIVKDCGFGQGCLFDGNFSYLNGVKSTNVNANFNRNTNVYKIIIADGVSLIFASNQSYNTLGRGSIIVCINGLKSEGIYGVNLFQLKIAPDYKLLMPRGDKDEEFYTFKDDCINLKSSHSGAGCAAWVIFNGNMDYLHCPKKLGWDKASSCKD